MAEVGLVDAGLLRPRLRGRLHQIAFVVAVPAGVLLIAMSRGVTAHIASTLFVLSLLALFGASGTYHMSHWPPIIKARLQRLDHAMIFVLIAGSYTPVALLALQPAWGITFLILAWGIAAGGAILAVWHINTIHRFAAILYIGFGWLLVFALPEVLRALDPTELVLLAAGGVLYTVGAIGLWLKRPDPSPAVFGYHEVWHAMTLLAAGCHYTLVLLLVRG
ncbi:MAG: PAQR family membrane homeostasis protein TrhA [Acidimicrobiia bacterium]